MIRIRIAAFALPILATACAGSAATVSTASTPAANLVLTGGSIVTMRPEMPRAEAVAIREGHVAAVGSDAEVRRFVGPATRVVDLHGRTVTPGLVDAHCHLYGLGEALESLSLRGLPSVEAVAKVVGEAARSRAAGEWITGQGWDQNRWSPAVFPITRRSTRSRPRTRWRWSGSTDMRCGSTRRR
ncbi:MAG: amidohydrolase family protein [Minicystis sp.]